MAYNCRMNKNLLDGKQPYSAKEISRCVDGVSKADDLNFAYVKISDNVR